MGPGPSWGCCVLAMADTPSAYPQSPWQSQASLHHEGTLRRAPAGLGPEALERWGLGRVSDPGSVLPTGPRRLGASLPSPSVVPGEQDRESECPPATSSPAGTDMLGTWGQTPRAVCPRPCHERCDSAKVRKTCKQGRVGWHSACWPTHSPAFWHQLGPYPACGGIDSPSAHPPTPLCRAWAWEQATEHGVGRPRCLSCTGRARSTASGEGWLRGWETREGAANVREAWSHGAREATCRGAHPSTSTSQAPLGKWPGVARSPGV